MPKFRVILADPPWAFANKRTGGSLKSGAAQKYPTMAVKDICRMDVPSVCERDALLFLWVPTALAVEGAAIEVAKAWGFAPRTKLYWHKTGRYGLGFWFRNEVEEMWLCVRGKVKPFRSPERNLKSLDVERHSVKPQEFRRLIDRECDRFELSPRLEMFARPRGYDVSYEGDPWYYHGNEIPGCFTRVVDVPTKEEGK